MGRPNKTTATGINLGETAEAAFGIQAISTATGQLPGTITEALLRSSRKGSSKLQFHNVSVSVDKKSATAILEVHEGLKREDVRILAMLGKAASLLASPELAVGKLSTVELLGAGRQKCDVRLVGSSKTVAVNLKYGHDAPTCRQSLEWERIASSFAEIGFDISFFKAEYETSHATFSKPALRNSGSKADYSPELTANAEQYRLCERSLFKRVAAGEASFAPAAAARGILELYCGDESEIVFADLKTGAMRVISAGSLQELSSRFASSVVTFRTAHSARTNHLWVLLNGVDFIHVQSTVSAKAYKKVPNMRVVKPQMWFAPSLDVAFSAEPASTKARSRRPHASALHRFVSLLRRLAQVSSLSPATLSPA
jgi:hypothetical protein